MIILVKEEDRLSTGKTDGSQLRSCVTFPTGHCAVLKIQHICFNYHIPEPLVQ
jgi:hypothetical protein